jgi:hypothetical protein
MLQDPINYRKLTPPKQLHALTISFFDKATDEPMVVNKKLSSGFWKVKAFFKKQTLEQQHLLYDYMWSLQEKTPHTMTELFQKADEYNQGLKFKDVTVITEKYEDFMEVLQKWN